MEYLSRSRTAHYDVVVVGGGMSGICAAVAAARHGAKTALLQGRAMLGGNASSEIRMHICGANCQMAKSDVNETGILMEILMENKRLNPRYNFNLWDAILLDFVKREANLTLYLNTVMHEVATEGDRITAITAYQNTTEVTYTFTADIFLDCTGHSTLGYFAGAETRIGSEGREEFGEAHAPAQPTDALMGNTLLFKAIKYDHPVEFTCPDWAIRFTEEDLRHRVHYSFVGTLGNGGLAEGEDKSGLPELYCVDYGYWWLELGGDTGDIIGQSEEIRDELMKSLWGVWDHIKNGGDHGAANYDLQWCGIIPGTRDSRRMVGDYLLNENDILANRQFDDAVAYGGWPMDVHTPGGLHDTDKAPSYVINFDGLYTIPWRSYYSKNIQNLIMAGRNISATKMGMSSIRVMGTCAVGGQAAGTAAAMCVAKGCTPRAIGEHIDELQQTLLRDDCYIPGIVNRDDADLARTAAVTASTAQVGYEAASVVSGVTRRVGEAANLWRSTGLGADAALHLTLAKAVPVREVRLVFDPDLTRDMVISLSGKKQAQQLDTLAPCLVKAYTLRLLRGGEVAAEVSVEANRRRLAVHAFAGVEADAVELVCTATYGERYASVYEVRVY